MAKYLVAVRVGLNAHVAVDVPSCLARRPQPLTPDDLTAHHCINLRLQCGGLLTLVFDLGGREVKVRGEGCLVFNSTLVALESAVAGYGLAYLLKDRVQACLADRQLVLVLADLCPPFSECQLHYLNRQQAASAFALLVDALRCRG